MRVFWDEARWVLSERVLHVVPICDQRQRSGVNIAYAFMYAAPVLSLLAVNVGFGYGAVRAVRAMMRVQCHA